MAGEFVAGLVFLALGVLGLIYNKKIANLYFKGNVRWYGYVFGKKTKEKLGKDEMFAGFFRGMVIFISLAFIISALLAIIGIIPWN